MGEAICYREHNRQMELPQEASFVLSSDVFWKSHVQKVYPGALGILWVLRTSLGELVCSIPHDLPLVCQILIHLPFSEVRW